MRSETAKMIVEQQKAMQKELLDLRELIRSEGARLIAAERTEHFTKHNRTLEKDMLYNDYDQLTKAASALIDKNIGFALRVALLPTRWNLDIWQKMCNKPYKARLIIAGALIAAQIDIELEHERRAAMFRSDRLDEGGVE